MKPPKSWLSRKVRGAIDSLGDVLSQVQQNRLRRFPSPFRGVSTGAFLLATWCFLFVGCDKTDSSQDAQAPQKPETKIESQPGLPIPEVVVSEEKAEQDKIAHEATDLLAKRDFTGLDKRVRELRAEKRIYPDGTWALRSFYDGIETVAKNAPDTQWMALIALLNDWIKVAPDSITPRVALAETLFSYAWKARGSGWADTITEEGGRLMEQRLGAAHKILAEARNLHEKCPRFCLVSQRVALGEGWDPHAYNTLCDEGLALYPDNQPIYFNKAYNLQPRWYGKQGEWEQFAAASAEKLGGNEGEMLYARIIWHLNEMNIFHNIFAESGIKWDRVKRSFEVLQRKYPDSLQVISEFASLASNAGDWKKARELFTVLGGRVDTVIFPRKETFIRYRNDAYTH